MAGRRTPDEQKKRDHIIFEAATVIVEVLKLSKTRMSPTRLRSLVLARTPILAHELKTLVQDLTTMEVLDMNNRHGGKPGEVWVSLTNETKVEVLRPKSFEFPEGLQEVEFLRTRLPPDRAVTSSRVYHLLDKSSLDQLTARSDEDE